MQIKHETFEVMLSNCVLECPRRFLVEMILLVMTFMNWSKLSSSLFGGVCSESISSEYLSTNKMRLWENKVTGRDFVNIVKDFSILVLFKFIKRRF